ncbi:MAG: NADH-quinone oxidoreductase subunit C [Elusimicrobia bacterium]|nr:NADH-quinone oxidoreductase subunit C [Elusimicrobiota bacterium]
MSVEEVLARLFSQFPKADKAAAAVRDYPTVQLKEPSDLVPAVQLLKEEFGFAYLDMVTAVDWKGPVDMRGYLQEPNPNIFRPSGAPPRESAKPAPGLARDAMTVVYALSSLSEGLKIFLKIDVPREGAKLPSLTGLFNSADWQEREAFDLLGISFEGHPNLKKILTPDFLEGHPLRKDYVHVKDRFDVSNPPDDVGSIRPNLRRLGDLDA